MNEKIEIRPGRVVNISTYLRSEAQKTVFLLHGLGGRGEQWQAEINALAASYNVIVPDMLGQGHSDKPRPEKNNPYSFAELDADIHAIFKRYRSTTNVIAGHSYGGALATSLALSYPDQIEKLILLSPTPLAPNTKIPFLFTLPAFIMEYIRPILEWQMAHLIFDPSTNPELVKSEIVISRQNPMYMIKSLIHGFLTAPKADISQLRTPTLILLGEHDKLIPPKVSLQFYQALPNHKVVMLEHVSHMALMEKPLKVCELLRHFI